VALAYLIGSIPFSLLLGRLVGVDIRAVGSGNIGATNLGRACGRRWGVAGFALDVCKGTAPVLGAGLAMGWAGGGDLATAAAWRWLAVAAAAMLGHVFPVYLKFRGGKGVATGFGVMLGVWPYLTLPASGALLTWLIFAASLRYVGLASVVAAAAMPGFVVAAMFCRGGAWSTAWPFVAVTAAMAALVGYRHRGNLARLARGTEPRLGQP